MTRPEVLKEVIAAVVEITLGEVEGVSETSLLGDELGLESIDILDLLFGLEERFGMTLGPPPPFLDAGFFEAEAGHFDDGALTERGMQALEDLSWLSPRRLHSPQGRRYLSSLEVLVDMVIYHRSPPDVSGGQP